MKYTKEQLELIAENNRQMDNGERPYVFADGRRAMVSEKAMKHFNLSVGQTVSLRELIRLMRFDLGDSITVMIINDVFNGKNNHEIH